MGINIRMAEIDDIEKLIEIRFDYFRAENLVATTEQNLVVESNLRHYIARCINSSFYAAFVEENGEIASVAFLAISERPANIVFPTGKIGTVYNVFTYPQYRNRGYATKAMSVLIEEAKRLNLSFVELSASESGKPIYQKLGFKETEPSSFTPMMLSLL